MAFFCASLSNKASRIASLSADSKDILAHCLIFVPYHPVVKYLALSFQLYHQERLLQKSKSHILPDSRELIYLGAPVSVPFS